VLVLAERSFTNKLYELIVKEKELGKHGWLRKVYKNKNLSTKEFQNILDRVVERRIAP
jgi:AAA+ ATPase superfamily predicted ATPase